MFSYYILFIACLVISLINFASPRLNYTYLTIILPSVIMIERERDKITIVISTIKFQIKIKSINIGLWPPYAKILETTLKTIYTRM